MTYLLGRSTHIYVGFETLKAKCTQHEICSQATLENTKVMFFSKLGGTGNSFRSDQKNPGRGQNVCGRAAPAWI
jgi:hypothetical protein